MSFSDLPKVIIKYLFSFLDIKSQATFSLANKKYYKAFAYLRVIFKMIKHFHQDLLQYLYLPRIIEESQKISKPILLFTCENKQISFDIIKYLIESKSELNFNSKYKKSPLHLACKNRNSTLEIIKLLVESKSDLNLEDGDNNTPLHFACKNEKISYEIIQYLVESKSYLNYKNNYSCSPLHLAFKN